MVLGYGNTAEAIVKKYKISREDQDLFAYESNMKAINAIEMVYLKDIIPYDLTEVFGRNEQKQKKTISF